MDFYQCWDQWNVFKKNAWEQVKLCLLANHWIVSAAVLDAHPGASETQVMEEMAKYLKYAPERTGGGGRSKH